MARRVTDLIWLSIIVMAVLGLCMFLLLFFWMR